MQVRRPGLVSLPLPVSTLNIPKYRDLYMHGTVSHFKIQKQALCWSTYPWIVSLPLSDGGSRGQKSTEGLQLIQSLPRSAKLLYRFSP